MVTAITQSVRALSSLHLALFLMLVMSLSDALAYTFAQVIGKTLDPATVLGFSGLLSTLFVLVRTSATRQTNLLRTRYPRLQLPRALTRVAGNGLAMYAVMQLPLSNYIVIGFFSPLLIVFLSTLLLKEKLHQFGLASAGLGLAGVFVICNVEQAPVAPMLMAMGAAALSALNAIFVRAMPDEHPLTFVFYTNLFLAVFFLPLAVQEAALLTPVLVLLLVIREAFGVLSSYLYFVANQITSPQTIAPMIYSRLLWGTLLGWLVWGHVPDMYFWAGAALIIISGLLLLPWRYLPKISSGS